MDKRFSELTNNATDFANDDVIALDGETNGTRKMSGSTLKSIMKDNTLATTDNNAYIVSNGDVVRIKDLTTAINDFRTGDVIPVDGPSGTAKMTKDDLLKETRDGRAEKEWFITSENTISEHNRFSFWQYKFGRNNRVIISVSGTTGVSSVQFIKNGVAYEQKTIAQDGIGIYYPSDEYDTVQVFNNSYGWSATFTVESSVDLSCFDSENAYEQSGIFDRSQNLVNPSDTETKIGYYIDENGNLNANSTYNTTGYIRVSPNKTYKLSTSARFVAFFYSDKSFCVTKTHQTEFIIPKNVFFIRITISATSWSSLMCAEKNNYPLNFEGYKKTLKKDLLPARDPIDITECTFASSINLLNKDDADVALGKYINGTDGRLDENASYNTSGWIKVANGTTYVFSTTTRFVGVYTLDKVFISRSENLNSFTASSDGYIRLSISVGSVYWDVYMMCIGQLPETYVPYRMEVQKNVLPYYLEGGMQAYSLCGWPRQKTFLSTLASGTNVTCSGVPFESKKGLFFSAEVYFSSFTRVTIGKGYHIYNGAYIVIDASNVYCYHYDGNQENLVGQVAHGLTLTTYLRVAVKCNENSKWKVTLESNGYIYSTEFSLWFEMSGVLFLFGAQAMTNVTLAGGNSDLKKPIWFFGDSYFGVNDQRWPYYVKQLGYWNFYFNGLSGTGSAPAYTDLKRSLKFGTPTYLVWCIGMNDTLSDWTNVFNKLKKLCTEFGIELVLATIPTTPTRDKEGIKALVESSGYRYIDFYSAVGTDSSGNWYAGMLSSDNVHPTARGAKALASQVLLDFPEIMG